MANIFKYIIQSVRKGLLINIGTKLYAFGDSITYGQGADPSSNSYINLLKTGIVGILTSFAAGGRGMWYAISLCHSQININTYGLVTAMVGYNDLRLGGDDIRLYNKIQGGHRILLSNAFGKYWYRYADFTPVGNWISSYSTIVGSRGQLYSITGGGTLSKTVTGSNFGFCFLGSNNATNYQFGYFSISIDGVSYYDNVWLSDKTNGLADGTYTYPVCPYMVNILGLTNTPHNIVISFTGFCAFDYMVVMHQPKLANSAIVISPYYTPLVWDLNAPANKGSNEVVDNVSYVLDQVVSEYKNVGFFVDKLNLMDSIKESDLIDSIHPNNAGHLKIYQLIWNRILLLSATDLFINKVLLRYDRITNIYYSIVNNWLGYGSSNKYLPENTDGYITAYLPNQTDCLSIMIGLNATHETTNYGNWEYGMVYTPSPVELRRISLGSNYAQIRPGYMASGSRIWLGRESGRIKIKYANDGINFVTQYDGWGLDSRALWANLSFGEIDRKGYDITTTNFID